MKPLKYYNTQKKNEPELTVNSRTPTIKLKNIIRIEGSSNYSLIHTKRGTIICTKSLKFFTKEIEDPRFFRTHKSHIVNLDYVSKYYKNNGSPTLGLTNGSFIEVARRRAKETLDRLKISL